MYFRKQVHLYVWAILVFLFALSRPIHNFVPQATAQHLAGNQPYSTFAWRDSHHWWLKNLDNKFPAGTTECSHLYRFHYCLSQRMNIVIKGGLIAESFSLWPFSQKNVPNLYPWLFSLVTKSRIMFLHIFGETTERKHVLRLSHL